MKTVLAFLLLCPAVAATALSFNMGGGSISGSAITPSSIVTSSITASYYGGSPLDISGESPAAPTAKQQILKLVAVRAFSFPASFTVSMATSSVKATAYAEFSIQKNSSEVGAFYFATDGTSATFKGSGASFSRGDILTIISSGTVDATLSGISFNLAGSL